MAFFYNEKLDLLKHKNSRRLLILLHFFIIKIVWNINQKFSLEGEVN